MVLGADSVRANGDVVNKVGSYPLALVAREARVPVYVLAETLKIAAPDFPLQLEPLEWPEAPLPRAGDRATQRGIRGRARTPHHGGGQRGGSARSRPDCGARRGCGQGAGGADELGVAWQLKTRLKACRHNIRLRGRPEGCRHHGAHVFDLFVAASEMRLAPTMTSGASRVRVRLGRTLWPPGHSGANSFAGLSRSPGETGFASAPRP